MATYGKLTSADLMLTVTRGALGTNYLPACFTVMLLLLEWVSALTFHFAKDGYQRMSWIGS